MASKWFCNECGVEIWEMLDEYIKNSETIAEAEKRCICSDCLLKKYKDD